MRAGSGRRVVARSGAAEAPQLAGMAGDDPHDLSAGLENGPFGPFFRRFAPFLSPFSYNSLIYLSKLYFFTNYSRVFGPILCDLLPAPPFALFLVAVAVLFSRSPLFSMSLSFPLLSSKFWPFSRCFWAVLWHPCRMIPNFGGRIRKNSVKTGVFGAKIRKNAAKPPEKLGKIRFVSPRWHVLTI